MAGAKPTIIWRPQPGPQAALISCPIFEILYGGARGGGKTDGMLGKFAVKAAKYGADVVGVFFRRTREDLREAMERSRQIYTLLGAEFHDQKKEWRFPNGARLKFQYLDRDSDADNYQGHNYTDLFFEELTHWADPTPINKLKATLRSATGIPCQFHATANPGGPGHQWVKARYIDPAPQGWKILEEDFTSPFDGTTVTLQRIFIPSRLTDNRILMDGDPLYVAKLQQSGSAELVRAWLEGDWNVVEGAYFDCWNSEKMVLRPFDVPEHWPRFRSMDWGSARPFSVGWWAVVSEDYIHAGKVIPRGALVRYREWYGAEKPNVGLKLTAEAVAQGIVDRETPFERKADFKGVADPAMFANDGGPSIAERIYAATGMKFKPADNKRVARRGHLGGWDQMRARMVGENNRPMIYCFSTCSDSIRTIPSLQHDKLHPEDVDTESEDHAADEWRYACMSRPYTPPAEAEAERGKFMAVGPSNKVTLNDVIKPLTSPPQRERI